MSAKPAASLTPLLQRKLVELRRKVASLDAEFDDWRNLSREGALYRKHHNQIERLAAWLASCIAIPAGEIAEAEAKPQTALARCHDIEVDILAAHRLWDYFRRKLMLRSVERFERFLFAADEFAWACYQPAQVRASGVAADQFKEPPLVYFHGSSSPVASSREVALEESELASGDTPPKTLLAILHTIPIPIVGMPWYQIEHLPDAIILGHEVGHNICDDFGLIGRVARLIDASGAATARLSAWQSWKDEIFADFYGCLAGGPAFVSALMDFLACDPAVAATATVDEENTGWGSYPPEVLRVLLNLEHLRKLMPDFDVEAFAAEWKVSYPRHAMSDFEPDLPAIAEAFRRTPFPEFGGAKLPEMLSFDSKQHDLAWGYALDANSGGTVPSSPARILFASARLAYAADSAAFERHKVADHLLAKVPRTNDIRGDDDRPKVAPLAERVAADRKAGAAALARLRASRVRG